MKVGTNLVNVQTCTEKKDFGITFDNLLKFDVHIQNAVSKANRMIGILRYTFTLLDKVTYVQLYKAFIRPHVEYDSAIWYPYQNWQSAAIEKVQRQATKLVQRLKTCLIQEDCVYYHYFFKS